MQKCLLLHNFFISLGFVCAFMILLAIEEVITGLERMNVHQDEIKFFALQVCDLNSKLLFVVCLVLYRRRSSQAVTRDYFFHTITKLEFLRQSRPQLL
jgi:hypothetical protein